MPDNPQVRPSSAPTNKAVAATGASAFGAAVSILILYFADRGDTLPDEVKGAITTIVTAVVTALAAYFVPPGSGEAVILDSAGKAQTARVVG
ncbi:MAG TPA: hypothetical protein VF619_13200 [Allosphingosinicella sp.]